MTQQQPRRTFSKTMFFNPIQVARVIYSLSISTSPFESSLRYDNSSSWYAYNHWTGRGAQCLSQRTRQWYPIINTLWERTLSIDFYLFAIKECYSFLMFYLRSLIWRIKVCNAHHTPGSVNIYSIWRECNLTVWLSFAMWIIKPDTTNTHTWLLRDKVKNAEMSLVPFLLQSLLLFVTFRQFPCLSLSLSLSFA